MRKRQAVISAKSSRSRRLPKKSFETAQRLFGSTATADSAQYMLYYCPQMRSSSRRRGIFRKESNLALVTFSHGSHSNRDML